MISLCRILRSFIGYIVDGDIGAFPLQELFPLCTLALALVVSMSPRHIDICPSPDLLKLPGYGIRCMEGINGNPVLT
jgi:hypothetical protein